MVISMRKMKKLFLLSPVIWKSQHIVDEKSTHNSWSNMIWIHDKLIWLFACCFNPRVFFSIVICHVWMSSFIYLSDVQSLISFIFSIFSCMWNWEYYLYSNSNANCFFFSLLSSHEDHSFKWRYHVIIINDRILSISYFCVARKVFIFLLLKTNLLISQLRYFFARDETTNEDDDEDEEKQPWDDV